MKVYISFETNEFFLIESLLRGFLLENLIHFFEDFGVLRVFGQVIVLIGIFFHVVEFYILVAAPICINPGVFAESAKVSMNIMSFNIRYGTAKDGANHWDKRKHLVHGLIKEHSTDIMGVQEALEFQMQTLQKNMSSYSSLGIPRGTEGNNEYSAIFYKKDQYSVLDHGTFWLSSTPEKPSTSWE